MTIFFPEFTRTELIEKLRAKLPALQAALPVTRVVLFGSWAHGRATVRSDVDLMVVYSDPPRPNAYELVRDTMYVTGLEPHIYAESEAAANRRTLDRMTADGVTLL